MAKWQNLTRSAAAFLHPLVLHLSNGEGCLTLVLCARQMLRGKLWGLPSQRTAELHRMGMKAMWHRKGRVRHCVGVLKFVSSCFKKFLKPGICFY